MAGPAQATQNLNLGDTAERLDYARMSQVVVAVWGAVQSQ